MSSGFFFPRPVNQSLGAMLFAATALCASLQAGAAGIAMGPYLQHATSNGMTVVWWTDFTTSGRVSRVEYGAGLASTQSATEADVASFSSQAYHFVQVARLTGLTAGTSYDYRVVSSDGGNTYTSAVHTFRTAPDFFSPVHFAHTADGQPNSAANIVRTRMLLAQTEVQGADFVLYSGDMVDVGRAADWHEVITEMYCSDNGQTGSGVASRIPFAFVIGNHEIYDDGGYSSMSITGSIARYKAVCDNPDNGSADANWNERYYAFWYGPCYIICLDANNTSDDVLDNSDHLPDASTPDWEPNSEQNQWLVRQLAYAQRKAAFTFVSFHYSPYCRSTHGAPWEPQSGYTLRALDPLFHQYGVDGVLTGHDHVYERSVTGPPGFHEEFPGGLSALETWQSPSNLNYFVEGNGGNTARGMAAGWETWMDITENNAAPFFTAFYYSWAGLVDYFSFLDVDVAWNASSDAWRATFKVVRTDTNGVTTTHDEFWMERPNPPDVVYVDAGATGAVDGTSWADAYSSLATALTAAGAGQDVWVKAGTYTPGAARTDHFPLKLDVGLYGGFAGNETERSARNWAANPTVLSGDINGGGLDAGNSAHVVYVEAADAPAGAVLDGFTITQGYGNGGGGLGFATAGRATVRNCVFTANHGNHGGALCNAYAGANTLVIENSVFHHNTSPDDTGSAIGNDASGLQVMNCTFGANAGTTCTWDVTAGRVAVTNCILWDTDAPTASGGGVREAVAGSVTMSHGDVSGGWRGTSGSDNLGLDPAFINLAAGNLRLGNTSPCIDIGTGTGAPDVDLDGITRPQGEGIDLGAYERVRLELPGNVVASDGTYADRVTVQWTGVYGATGYEVWRHTTSDAGGAGLLAGTTGLAFNDSLASPLTNYYYWVRATNLTDTSGLGGGDSGYRGVALGDNPVALLKFAETTGSTAADATGHGNHGELGALVTFQPAGGPTLAGSGVTLAATEFPGTASVSNAITVSDSASLDFDKSHGTVVMWIKLNNTSGRKTFIKSSPFSASAGLELACNNTSLFAYPPGGQNAPYALAAVLTTAWTHLAMVWEDGVGTRLYVNGTQVATAGDFTPYADTGKWIIGRDIDNGREFGGRMADVAIFLTALTQAEIQAVMSNSWPTHTITINTAPTGRSVAVDQLALTAPATFTVVDGAHVVSIADPQSGTTGRRYLFDTWSNGQPQIQALNVSADSVLTATFTTQVLWTAAASPGGAGTIAPASGTWHAVGSNVTAAATANAGWAFDHWTGDLTGSAPSTPLTITTPATVTGVFSVASGYVTITVASSPAGRNLVVDGVDTTGDTFSWLEGSVHTVEVAVATQPGATGVQYAWQTWSDSGAQAHAVTASASGTLTASFQTQYAWTVSPDPAEGGTVVPASGGWYPAGSSFTATATPATSYTFANWSGTLNGAATNLAVTMNAPVIETAAFTYTPTIAYVDIDAAAGAKSGASWADAYTNLQTALGAVTAGEIWVAEGTYMPGTTRAQYFNPAAGVKLYGGFAGTEATRSARTAPALHPTVLSGDINGGGLDSGNAEHVIYLTFGHDGVTIDGFTITQAWGDYGGGLRMDGSGSLTVNKCIFTANYTPSYHGAAWGNYYHGDNDVLVQNCLFYGNSSGGAGGAVMVNYGTTRVINCTAYGNSGGTYTWYVSDGSVSVENSILWDTGGSGGGIYEKVAGNTTVTFCDVNGGWNGTSGGTGVIAGNPNFVNAAGANFQLQAGSPCIDQGNAENAPDDDLAGTARDAAPDLGVFEYAAAASRSLTVASDHGTPSPAVGAHSYPDGTLVSASVSSPETAGSTRYVCTGWTLTGHAPAGGSGTNVSITLTNDATLTWQWSTQHLWTTAVTPVGAGTVAPVSGTWYDQGSTFTATATTNIGWAFTNWTGTLTGTSTSLAVTMTGPVTETATFDFRGSNFTSQTFGNFITLGAVVDVPSGYTPSQIGRVELYEVRTGGDRRLLDPLQVGTNAYYAASVFDLAPGSTTTFRAIFYNTSGQMIARNTFSGQTRAEPGSTPAAVATIHVATNGADANPGTVAFPKRTLAGALTATSQAGTHIVMHGGIYYEGPVFPPNVGTTANPLVIEAAAGETPILDGSDELLLQSGWTSLGGGYVSRAFTGQTWLIAARNRITGTVTRAYPMATLAELNGKYSGNAANTFAKYNITAAYYCSGTTLTVYCPEFSPGGEVDLHVSVRDTGVEQDADHHITYEGLTFRFYEGKGIYVNRSDDVIVRDCRFTYVNTPIGIKRASNRLLVESSDFIDDCARWGFLPKGADGYNYNGYIETGAVNVYSPYDGRGLVFRQNTIDGLFDGAHLVPFGATVPGVKSSETDFYSNTVVRVLDDLIEVDGISRNVRIFHNTMERYLTGISIAQATEGPTYVLYNILGRHGDSTASTIDGYVGYPVKSNGGTDYGTTGWVLLYHNSGWTAASATPGFKVQSATWRQLVLANNIWFGTDTGWSVYRDAPLSPVSMSHDIVWRASGPFFHKDYGTPKDYATQADVAASGLSDIYFLTNAIAQNPSYLNPASGDYGLNTGSPAIDAGVIVPGVNDEQFMGTAPDVGSREYTLPASVTLATSPTGLLVAADGVTNAAPQSLSWTPGLSHTISAPSPQGGAQTQHVFTAWSDSGAQSHTVAPWGDTAYTATFTTQYLWTVAINPPMAGAASPTSGTWFNAGANFTATATPNAGWVFDSWTGTLTGTDTNLAVTMNGAASVSANFVTTTTTSSTTTTTTTTTTTATPTTTTSSTSTTSTTTTSTTSTTTSAASLAVTFDTLPAGLAIAADGQTNLTPWATNWTDGTAHTLDIPSPQGGAQTQFVFVAWSDGDAQNHTSTVVVATNFTASFNAQYRWTADITPPASGTVSPASGAWFDAGTNFTATATPNAGWVFDNWTGTLTGTDTNLAVTMNGAASVSANFVTTTTTSSTTTTTTTTATPTTTTSSTSTTSTTTTSTTSTTTSAASLAVTFDTLPAGLALAADGQTNLTPWSTNWVINSAHALSAPSPQGGALTQYVFGAWSDGGATSHSVTVSVATNYTASFNLQHRLLVTGTSGGSVSTPGGWFDAGTGVVVTATAASGYDFSGWWGDTQGDTNSPVMSVLMDQARSLGATFSTNGLPAGPAALTVIQFR
ncbi:MAG: right-handed parallel beta-helix repeat-containing protein [Lentisphaerae bacterium]|nr:right-handed parallel beta-helix repeat-containing protein [Lentisphaerota bacterium]